jgi:hypothetical protein
VAVCIPVPVDTQVSPFTDRLQGTATLMQNDDAVSPCALDRCGAAVRLGH